MVKEFYGEVILAVGIGILVQIISINSNTIQMPARESNLNGKNVILKWKIDWQRREVNFLLTNIFDDKFKWFALGFANRKKFKIADVCLFDAGSNGSILDGFIDDDVLEIDERQDFQLLKMDNSSVNFTRKFDTNDVTDVQFHDSTTSLIYIREVSSPKFPYQLIYNFSQTNERYGSVSVQLLSAAHYKVDDSSSDVKILDIKLEDQLVPSTTNTYYCKYLKVPEGVIDKQKNLIIQFEAIRSPTSLTNFMLLFSCNLMVDDDALAKTEVCNEFMETKGLCEKIIAVWGRGSPGYTYPLDIGFPIGGRNSNPYMKLVIHLANPNQIPDFRETVGFRLRVTENLRKHDAGILKMGVLVVEEMSIPPRQSEFPIRGHCLDVCTEKAIPEEGITMFASTLHTHDRGVSVRTQHLRNYTEIGILPSDEFYDPFFQEVRTFEKTVTALPGDYFITSCYYDTQQYENATEFGFQFEKEMCTNYVAYYPVIDFQYCLSAITKKSMTKLLTDLERKEGLESLGLNKTIFQMFQKINWTSEYVQRLKEWHAESPVTQICLKYDLGQYIFEPEMQFFKVETDLYYLKMSEIFLFTIVIFILFAIFLNVIRKRMKYKRIKGSKKLNPQDS